MSGAEVNVFLKPTTGGSRGRGRGGVPQVPTSQSQSLAATWWLHVGSRTAVYRLPLPAELRMLNAAQTKARPTPMKAASKVHAQALTLNHNLWHLSPNA